MKSSSKPNVSAPVLNQKSWGLLSLALLGFPLLSACAHQPTEPSLSQQTLAFPAADISSQDIKTQDSSPQHQPLYVVIEPSAPMGDHGTVEFIAPVTEPMATVPDANPAEQAQPQHTQPDQQLFLFGFNQQELPQEAIAIVHQHGAYLSLHPEIRVFVNGHSDSQGNPVYNERLALARARYVATELMAAGANEEQLIIQSFGANEPTQASELYSDQRRVELIFNQNETVSELML